MPALTLVVCVHRQRDLLERLLRESQECYDELLVLHDTPDVQNVQEVAAAAGGRFFEMPSAPVEEVHWPFAWGQAKNDWIIKVDADEFPSAEMKAWLKQFRRSQEPAGDISGFTCIWPLWNGERAISKRWPRGRIFIFNKRQVRYFGMSEQLPVPDGKYEALDFILHHQPKRKSYGLHNSVVRKQTRRSAAYIGRCFLGKPTDLPCWRWDSDAWPEHWERIRRSPLRASLYQLVLGTLRGLRDQWRCEGRLFPSVALNGPAHYTLIAFEFWRARRRQTRNKQ